MLRTESDTGALLSFWVFIPPKFFLFRLVVPFQKLPVISKRILIGGWILKPRVPHSKMEIADRPKLANNIKLEGVPT